MRAFLENHHKPYRAWIAIRFIRGLDVFSFVVSRSVSMCSPKKHKI